MSQNESMQTNGLHHFQISFYPEDYYKFTAIAKCKEVTMLKLNVLNWKQEVFIINIFIERRCCSLLFNGATAI